MKNIHKVIIADGVSLYDNVTMTLESNYLLISNKKKVADLISHSELNRNDIIDIFISLHIVLELGINTFFRKLVTPTLKKHVNPHEMMENLDNVNFIDKTIMFVYSYKFNFSDIDEATKYHKIIGKLKAFSEMRNKLLHGHSISSISRGGKISESKMIKNLNLSKLQSQIKDFRFILEGMCFYLDALDYNLAPLEKENFKKTYLDHSFIPNTSFSSE